MNTLQNDLTLSERLQAPTPPFFRTLRNIGLLIGAIGAAIIAAPVALPTVVISVAGYFVTAGAVVAAVSSTTVDFKELARTQLPPR